MVQRVAVYIDNINDEALDQDAGFKYLWSTLRKNGTASQMVSVFLDKANQMATRLMDCTTTVSEEVIVAQFLVGVGAVAIDLPQPSEAAVQSLLKAVEETTLPVQSTVEEVNQPAEVSHDQPSTSHDQPSTSQDQQAETSAETSNLTTAGTEVSEEQPSTSRDQLNPSHDQPSTSQEQDPSLYTFDTDTSVKDVDLKQIKSEADNWRVETVADQMHDAAKDKEGTNSTYGDHRVEVSEQRQQISEATEQEDDGNKDEPRRSRRKSKPSRKCRENEEGNIDIIEDNNQAKQVKSHRKSKPSCLENAEGNIDIINDNKKDKPRKSGRKIKPSIKYRENTKGNSDIIDVKFGSILKSAGDDDDDGGDGIYGPEPDLSVSDDDYEPYYEGKNVKKGSTESPNTPVKRVRKKQKSLDARQKKCKREIKEEGDLEEVLIATKGQKRKDQLVCKFCSKHFTSTSGLYNHEKRHQNILEGVSYQCQHCEKSYHSKNALRLHEAYHNPKFVCDFCGKIFAEKNCLQVHVNSKHTKEVEYPCTFCTSNFYSKRALVNHVHNIHGEGSVPKPCHVCGVMTKNMKEHMMTHQDNKGGVCHICNKLFKRWVFLKDHLLEVHGGEEANKFQCTWPDCDKVFKRKRTLQAHLNVHNDVRPHACTMCPKKFRTKLNLTNHINWHNGFKPFQCELCGYKAIHKGNLQKHMQTRHKNY